jgi:hypothetical protein
MERSSIGWLLVVVLVGGSPAAARGADAAKAQDASVVGEVLEVLKDRGLVDDAEYQRLAAKNAGYEEKHKSWAPKIELGGDFRFRHESFWFDSDETGSDRDDRYRLRYRLRVNAKTEVNEWSTIFFQLVSGDSDLRSTNQTLGDGVDFDTDDIRLDLAYAQLRAPSDWVPLPEGKATVELGKVPNPFLWKVGKDFMLWDNDITFEGASLRMSSKASESVKLFVNAGYYVLDENGSRKDPHLWAAQLGGSFDVAESVTLGARGSYYQFNSLDSAFIGRAATGAAGSTVGGGALSDGLVGDPDGNDSLRVAELAAYLTWAAHETWPITIYGDWSRNLDAESSALPNTGSEDTAWGLGLEVGDKKQLVLVGIGYWHIEANAFPAQFIDSDLFDGITNREGFALYGSREVFKNTELNLTLFLADEIESDLPAFAFSARDAERIRLQADMVWKF